MCFDAPLMGIVLFGRGISASTSYSIDNAQITSATVEGEIVRKMGNPWSEVLGTDTEWCSSN